MSYPELTINLDTMVAEYNGSVIELLRFQSAPQFADFLLDEWEKDLTADQTNFVRKDLIKLYTAIMEV